MATLCLAWKKDQIGEGTQNPGRSRSGLVSGRTQNKHVRAWEVDWFIKEVPGPSQA